MHVQVTGSNDFNLKLWDVKTGLEKSRLTGHVSAITGVAYSVRHLLWLPHLVMNIV